MTATVRLSAGDGWLARRDDGLLFVAAGWPEALDAFAAAGSAAEGRDAVTDAAAAAGFDVPSFVIVTWTQTVECVVFGALEVQTDDPTAPMLTGSGSGTWIERRLRIGETPLGIRTGEAAVDGSRLGAGVVPAGGFELTVEAPIAAPVASDPVAAKPAASESSSASSTRPESDAGAAGHRGGATEDDDEITMTAADFAARVESELDTAGPEPGTDGAPPVRRASDLEAIAAAAGDDWMEESLGLRRPRSEQIAAKAESAGANGRTIDDESTWIPSDHHDDAGSEVDPPPASEPSGDPPAIHPPTIDPPPADPGWMTRPPDLTDQIPAPQALVQARRCPRGHLNPPQIARCRVCAEPIDPTADVETTRQPLLANAVLADATTIPIDGTVVLGRNPDRNAARVNDDARLVTLSASTAVSRTHVAMRADEWSLTATDCGSRGGVVVVTPGHEPVMLEPWIPQEISVGDTIYLGGPTSVRIDPAE